ncbi:hypothetical protein OFC63_29280, partial [Escherichia coli]|nr:hypothetical protein [Escherichia coli]
AGIFSAAGRASIRLFPECVLNAIEASFRANNYRKSVYAHLHASEVKANLPVKKGGSIQFCRFCPMSWNKLYFCRLNNSKRRFVSHAKSMY